MDQSSQKPEDPDTIALSEAAKPSPAKKRRVLLIGASGFLGAKILHKLKLDPDICVIAMSRKAPKPNKGEGVEWVQGDMLDPASLHRAMQDVDVVITSANGYMKESIEADFQGNRNLVDAVATVGISRFVFLSIVACENAPQVPHFHAKYVAEGFIKSLNIPYIIIRAPAFLDQSTDHIASNVKAGRYVALGDKTTRWSYVLTDDLAADIAKAATYPDDNIHGQTIDIGWADGPKNQQEIANLISEVLERHIAARPVPWLVLRMLKRPIKLFSQLGYDIIQMLLFFRTGNFVSNISKQERFFGVVPTSRDAITRWAKGNGLIS